MSRDTRLRALAAALGLIVCLVASNPPAIVGDGGEYLVYSLNFASLNGPSLRTVDLDALKSEARDYAPHLEDETFFRNAVRGRGGGWDFMHFWFLSLTAAPFVALAKAVGLPPIYGFVGLNLMMLLGAVWVALPRIGIAATALLFGSPLIWWFDKAHPEVFTVTLLAVSLLLIREKPWWSMVAAGAASTQYPHVAVLIGVIAVAAVWFDRTLITSRKFLLGVAAGSLLAILHPGYYYVRHGTPSLLLQVSNTGAPTWAELSVVLLDPEIGLFANFPVFPIVVLSACVVVLAKHWRGLVASDVVVSVVSGLFFIWVFGVKDNVHHGATPSVSRYALWFIPLAIPLLRHDALNIEGWRRFTWGAAVVSAGICAFAFHPSLPDHAREPTWPAQYLWARHPGWHNPLPEVFTGTYRRTEDLLTPTALPGCEKVLLGGPGAVGTWPVPCFPAEIPIPCGSKGVWCYANRRGSGYAFVRAPGRWNGIPVIDDEITWPREAEETVRRFYREWQWWNLGHDAPSLPALESSRAVHVQALEGADRFLLVLREPRPDASLTFKLPGPMNGVLIDARTGQTLQALQYSGGAGQVWDVPIPSQPNLMLLAMKR